MKVEILGLNDNGLKFLTKKQMDKINASVSKEMSSIDHPTIKELTKANKTLVVDILDIRSGEGALLDTRLFNAKNMPISGKMLFWKTTRLEDFVNPKILSKNLMSAVEQLVENAKMIM